MATHLDLQEQEQLDEFKHFWQRFGTPILALVTAVLLAYAGWNGWHWYQREQAAKAALLYDELERAVAAKEADKIQRSLTDLKDRYGATTWARQGALLAARTWFDEGKGNDARAAVEWVANQSDDIDYQWVARIRLAGLLMDDKQFDAALAKLSGTPPEAYAGLVADRRGDVLMAQGKRDDGVAAYKEAYRLLESQAPYRQVVELKLETLGEKIEGEAGR